MKNEIDVKAIMSYYWKNKFLILFIVILGGICGYLYTRFLVTPKYKSSTTIVLVKSSNSSSNNSDVISDSDLNLNSRLISTYAEIMKSDTISEKVVSNLKRDDISYTDVMDSIYVESVKNTDVIRVTITTKDAELSKDIATELPKVFSQEISRIYGIDNVSVVDAPKLNTKPTNVNYFKSVLAGVEIAFVGISFIVLLVAYFDNTVKSRDDVTNTTKYNVLATIPKYDVNSIKKGSKIISFADPKSVVSESFRALRTNLEFTLTDKGENVILVTSCHTGEGKSSCSSNLATVFAMQGKKTVLIDADMRRGALHEIFKLKNENGLSNLLSGVNFSDENFIKQTEVKNLWLINCGFYPPNPTELVSHDRMKELLDHLRKIFDIIIIDGTPLLPVADSAILAPLCDKVIVVTAYRETHKDELKLAKYDLTNANAKVAGAIINKNYGGGKSYKKYSNYAYSKDE